MKEPCVRCGDPTYTIVSGVGRLCSKCRDVENQNRVLEQSKSIEKCSDFKTWAHKDMSELFWIHLGRYIKEPNEESLSMIDMAYRWACHDNGGLANSFKHAMKWSGIDLWTEWQKIGEKK